MIAFHRAGFDRTEPNERRSLLRIALAALVMSGLPLTALAQEAREAPPQQFVGKWAGPWRLGMSSGQVELILTADAQKPGTIAVTNMAKFGDPPAEIYKVSRDGEKLLFRAAGADNSVMKVSVWPNPKDGSIEGFVVHDGFTNLTKLMRVP
jgi:hypothetical protein